MDKEMSKRLYHYTSADSLLKILENQTLRFNNLTAMDDPEEAKSQDSYNAGRWVFTSSWTTLRDDKKMFKDYGLSGKGVCISLPKYPFYTTFGNPYQHNKQIMASASAKPFDYTRGIEIYAERYNFVFYPAEVQQITVKYTDNEGLLYPRVSNRTHNDGISYFDDMLGKYKDTKWSYQDEIRYRLRPTMMNNIHRPKDRFDFKKIILDAIYDKISEDCPAKYIDIPIKLNHMEIILGNRLGTDEILEIKQVAKKYCLNPTFISSNIHW